MLQSSKFYHRRRPGYEAMFRSHHSSLYTFVFLSPLRFHTMYILLIWNNTPRAFFITPKLDIFSCSVQDNSLTSSTIILLFCGTSIQSYMTDILSIDGNNFSTHSPGEQHEIPSAPHLPMAKESKASSDPLLVPKESRASSRESV